MRKREEREGRNRSREKESLADTSETEEDQTSKVTEVPLRHPAPNCLLNTVTIEPHAVKLVTVTKPTYALNEQVLVGPSYELEGSPELIMVETLNEGLGRELVVPIFNCSTEPVTLPEGVKISRMETLQKYTIVDHNSKTRDPWEKLQLILRNKTKSPDNVASFKEWLETQEDANIELLKERKINMDQMPTDPKDRALVLKLMVQYREVFAKSNLDLGDTNITEHEIDTGDAKPIKQRPHKTPYALRDIMDKAVDDMLKQGITSESNSPWASPVVLVKKKDGSVRFCVDFRKVNAVTIKDSLPMPRIDDTIESFQGAKYFSTLDLMSGYWQIRMRERDKLKTAFVTPKGLYHFNRMPFGVTNGPATFQRAMDTMLHGMPRNMCHAFIDDIIIYSKTFDEHLFDLALVFEAIVAANLKAKAAKCEFFKEEVKYLGFIVSSRGIEPCQDKVQKVRDTPTPLNQKQLRSWLGLAGFYRKFVQDYSKIVQPLNCLLKDEFKNKSNWKWGIKEQLAFDTLKERLTNAPLLGYPEYGKDSILYTDASTYALGAVLAQKDEQGMERPIAYASRTLRGSELNYTITEKECLAVIWALKHFRQYCVGVKTTIITDHAAATWIFSAAHKLESKPPRLIRWALEIQDYDLNIMYRKGSLHKNADAMSREPIALADPAHFLKRENEFKAKDQKVDFTFMGPFNDLDDEIIEQKPNDSIINIIDWVEIWKNIPENNDPNQLWSNYQETIDELPSSLAEIGAIEMDEPPALDMELLRKEQRSDFFWEPIIRFLETKEVVDDIMVAYLLAQTQAPASPSPHRRECWRRRRYDAAPNHEI